MNIYDFSLFFVWGCLWFCGMGAYYTLFKRSGITYTQYPFQISLWYLLCSLIAIGYYMPFIIEYAERGSSPFVMFGSILILLISFFFYAYQSFDDKKLEQGKTLSLSYFISKLYELVFQQILILVLILLLEKYILNYSIVIGIFMLLFTLVHLPLYYFLSRRWFYYFILAVPVGAFVFATSIVYIPTGILISLAIHIFFYDATSFLIMKSKIKAKVFKF